MICLEKRNKAGKNKIMSEIMVRACILECKEYIIIRPTDPINQKLIRAFEIKHTLHPIITIPLNEVRDNCKNVEKELLKSYKNKINIL